MLCNWKLFSTVLTVNLCQKTNAVLLFEFKPQKLTCIYILLKAFIDVSNSKIIYTKLFLNLFSTVLTLNLSQKINALLSFKFKAQKFSYIYILLNVFNVVSNLLIIYTNFVLNSNLT